MLGKEKLLLPVLHSLEAVLTGGHQNYCQLKTPGLSGSLTFTDPSLLFIAIPAPCVLHRHPRLPCFFAAMKLAAPGIAKDKNERPCYGGWIFSSAKHKHPVLTWGS